jgi:RNA-directed DNA polymerase
VYCQDTKRRGEAEQTSFDFLGYTFRGRRAKGKHAYFVNFSPAMSPKAQKAIGQRVRGWHLRRRTGSDLSRLAEDINPQARSWINYYGAFYRSELNFLVRRINAHLIRWAVHKFKRLRDKPTRAWPGSTPLVQREPRLFAHWWLVSSPNDRPVGAG